MDDKLTLILFLIAPPLAGELLLLFLWFRLRRGAGTKATPLQVVWFNTLSVLMLVTLSFVGGELYFRHVYDTTDSLAFTKVSQQWGRRYLVENSAGFRDNIQYSLTRAPGKRRITFLGDSFTVGHGVKSVEDRFANRLRAMHPEWEVHTLAKLGKDTGGQLSDVQKYAQDGYEFDCVVLVYCLNDVADLFPEWGTALTRLNEEAKQAGWWRRHSYLIDFVYHRFKTARESYVKDYYGFVRDGYRGSTWELQQQRLTWLRNWAQVRGSKFLVVTFPFLHALGEDYEYRDAHRELNAFWASLQVPHLDLLPIFAGLPPNAVTVNRYDAHPNEHAHALAATAIEAFLVEHLGSDRFAPTVP